jgi:hypothetical protein
MIRPDTVAGYISECLKFPISNYLEITRNEYLNPELQDVRNKLIAKFSNVREY